MKIYLYELHDTLINNPESIFIRCSELEAEEKAKTYTFKDYCSPRIYKSEIGCVKKPYYSQVYLLENDEEKAKELFRNYLLKRLDEEKKRHEKECDGINKLLLVCQSEQEVHIQ